MISNKTATILFLIIWNMELAASSSNDTPGPRSSGKPVLRLGMQNRAIKLKKKRLQDMDDTVNPVEVQGENIEEMDISQGQPAPQVNEEFEALMNQEKYNEIFVLGDKLKMKVEEFLHQICPVVRTLKQYNGIAGSLKLNNLVASFYVHGSIGIVKEVIVESGDYIDEDYINCGDLEIALPLALEEDCHDRFIELLNIRKEITTEREGQRKLDGTKTSFEIFVVNFLLRLAPWENSATLKRFLAFRGDELRSKHPDILDTLCENLVEELGFWCETPEGEELFTDLVGQPSLLTPMSFAKGFLCDVFNEHRSIFIKCGWREAIKEGLKGEYEWGGEKLWETIKEEYPNQIIGEFPPTPDTLAAALAQFPTKQQKEEEWIKKKAAVLYNKLVTLEFTFNPLPDALWLMIFSYAIPWIDI